MTNKPIEKLIKFTPLQVRAIETYAEANDLMRGGRPNFSAAVRQLISNGLQLDMAMHDLKLGRPFGGE